MSITECKWSIFWDDKINYTKYSHDIHQLVEIQNKIMKNNNHCRNKLTTYITPNIDKILNKNSNEISYIVHFPSNYPYKFNSNNNEGVDSIRNKNKLFWSKLVDIYNKDNNIKFIFDLRSLRTRGENLMALFEPILELWKVKVLKSSLKIFPEIYIIPVKPYVVSKKIQEKQKYNLSSNKQFKSANIEIWIDKDTLRYKDEYLIILLSYLSEKYNVFYKSEIINNNYIDSISYLPTLHTIDISKYKSQLDGDRYLKIRIPDTKIQMNIKT